MSLFEPTGPLIDDHLTITFRAYGHPKPQGSKRAFIAHGRAVMTESNKAGHKDWRATVTAAAIDAIGDHPLLDGPLAVTIAFALPRPKSHPKTRTTWPTARPDIDKLTRSILDSCTHIIWRDDSQVTHLEVRKIWAEIDTPHGAGADITITALTPQGGEA